MIEERITTRCPSCGGRTLFIGSGGHLTCSFIDCPEPFVRAAIEALQEVATVAKKYQQEKQKFLSGQSYNEEGTDLKAALAKLPDGSQRSSKDEKAESG
jgi:hypothetical protein